jgi:hypothetical protein
VRQEHVQPNSVNFLRALNGMCLYGWTWRSLKVE